MQSRPQWRKTPFQGPTEQPGLLRRTLRISQSVIVSPARTMGSSHPSSYPAHEGQGRIMDLSLGIVPGLRHPPSPRGHFIGGMCSLSPLSGAWGQRSQWFQQDQVRIMINHPSSMEEIQAFCSSLSNRE